jgi:polysaccharide biosynthesis protein PslG
MFRHVHTSASQLLRVGLVLLCALAIFAVGAAGALAGPQYRGAQVHSLWPSVSSAEMTQELNVLQTAGVNVIRVDVGWATLETSRGGYDAAYLAKLDALSAGAQARGIKLIATLWQTPQWASSGGAWNDAPSNPADFGAFARFITSRYGSELAAVEVWNEPEINENLIASNLAATYVQMVKAVYTGAKQGDPAVPVLAGSLSYADIPFLRELYANGMQGYYDGISVHPYADGAAPGNTAVTHSFLGGIEALHTAQQAAGDDTPEWVTEFGWPTGTSTGANSEQQQAEYIEQAFALLDDMPYVEGASVYQLRDMETNASDPEDNFGLLRQNFAPTPAYAAFKAAMQVAPGTAPDPPSPFQPGAPETGSGGAGAGSGSASAPAAISDPNTPQTSESSSIASPSSSGSNAGASGVGGSSQPKGSLDAHRTYSAPGRGSRRARVASARSRRLRHTRHLRRRSRRR